MEIKETAEFSGKGISRRKYMAGVAGLLGLGCLSTSSFAGTFSSNNKSVKEMIVADEGYVLVDGWLLRADDLFL